VWSVKLVDDLRRAILEEGMRRVGQFGERHVQAELVWPGDPSPFANINTPEELKAAEARLARARSPSRRSGPSRHSRNSP
jgi:molybdopterin-guanine dinucleotide biosynthesis protein A